MGSNLIAAVCSPQWWRDTAGNCAAAFIAAYYGAWIAAGSSFETIISATYAKGGVVAAVTVLAVSLGVTPQVGDPERARLRD